MKYAVRYYSRSGNTKGVAEAIAEELGVEALSVKDEQASIEEQVDILYIGGALYAYGIDENLQTYLNTLTSDKVKKAVVFSTSWISKHAIDLIKTSLKDKGIEVEDDSFHSRGKPNSKALSKAKEFAKKYK